MTTIALTAISAPVLSGLTVSGSTAATGNFLSWTIPSQTTHFMTEIWAASTNNRASATLIATVSGSSFLHVLAAGTTTYYWIRSVTTYGVANGGWYPASATTGVAGTVAAVATADIAPGSVHVLEYTSGVASLSTLPAASDNATNAETTLCTLVTTATDVAVSKLFIVSGALLNYDTTPGVMTVNIYKNGALINTKRVWPSILMIDDDGFGFPVAKNDFVMNFADTSSLGSADTYLVKMQLRNGVGATQYWSSAPAVSAYIHAVSGKR